MATKFISISEAVTRYKISQNKVRKIVKEQKGTVNVQTVEIKGKHGFKYLVSVAYLDTMFITVNKVETKLKQSDNEPETRLKQDNQLDSQNKRTDSQIDNRLIKQLQETNKQLSDTVTSQQTTIKDLTTTLQEQQKIVIAQSLQIGVLSEGTSHHRMTKESKKDEGIKAETKKTPTIELLIITVLVVCIVAVIAFLLR